MTNTIHPLFFINALAVFLVACGGGGSDASAPPPPPPIVVVEEQETLAETLDAFLDANIEDNAPGLSVLLIKDDEVAYRNAKGMANNKTGLAIQSDTGFRLASVSKTFTAIAIMHLFEQQLISLDDSILAYLPELPESWGDITIHHLLSHRSGIVDYFNDFEFNDFPLRAEENVLTNQDILEYFTVNAALEFTPGSKGEYSNSGFVMLAEIISRVSGISFAEYMDINVFQPLGMHNSYIADEQTDLRTDDALNFAQFESQFDKQFYVTGPQSQVSSLDDLEKFIVGMLDHQILTADTFDLMATSYSNLEDMGSNYGYGMQIDRNNPMSFGHGGVFDGFRTKVLIRMDQNWHLVVLSNGGDVTGARIDPIAELVANFYAE
jgi:CubicO group peptidase (beta-lactamase class C family)